jgi:hypothetical protein
MFDMRPLTILVLALAALMPMACTGPAAPPPAPPVVVPSVPVPRPAISTNLPPWQDRARTPGDWVYRRDARGSLALFGLAGQDALFVVRCDTTARQIQVSRSGIVADGQSGALTFRGSDVIRTVRADNIGQTPSYVVASLPPRDSLLDALVYSRGRFLVSMVGSQDLVIPPWPEMAHVIEDCRG